ncbi:MAG: peptidase and in kexin sedolisin [Acidimicrobiales bacterium]|nr:peptidase and in kexin sedolisin [Acidimicrobiales bacterium]
MKRYVTAADANTSFGSSERVLVGRATRWFAACGLIVSGIVGGMAAPSHAGGTGSSDLADTGTLSAISRITGAQSLWNQGFLGQGVGVAVIDTGVARVPGLDAAGKVIDGPDLSFDSQDPGLIHVDAFGHGTHIAGIIAGSDVAPGTSAKGCQTCLGSSAYTDTTKFVGIAPQATIVNVKVGAYDGTVDVTQVIAGIDWVVQHRNDPGLNIRVLNLSFGTDSLQPAQIDPLAYAAEQAWRAGIVVVAAGGNDGASPGELADPAYSPSVIAVGTTDPRGTISTGDDVVADFAQHGTAQRPVDVAAPGVSVASLAVPGSFVDQNVATGKLGRFQRASGTSQSTAVVSGLAALILSKYPNATPDAVKTYLKASSTGTDLRDPTKHGGKDSNYVGAGSANVTMVATANSKDVVAYLRTIVSVPPTGTGLGSIEAARGTYHVIIDGVPLTGETDIFGDPFDTAAMAIGTASQSTWTGGVWNGARWTGDGWDGARWSAADWTGNDWTGARWTGARWTDAVWDGARWSGARWSGARWSAGSWEGARWSGARWSDNSWD